MKSQKALEKISQKRIHLNCKVSLSLSSTALQRRKRVRTYGGCDLARKLVKLLPSKFSHDHEELLLVGASGNPTCTKSTAG